MKRLFRSIGLVLPMATSLGQPVFAHEGLSSPVGMAYDAGGISLISGGKKARTIKDAAYVVDHGGTTVSRVDRQGARTVIADGLSSPVGLAVAPDGSLVVATWGANAAFQIRRP